MPFCSLCTLLHACVYALLRSFAPFCIRLPSERSHLGKFRELSSFQSQSYHRRIGFLTINSSKYLVPKRVPRQARLPLLFRLSCAYPPDFSSEKPRNFSTTFHMVFSTPYDTRNTLGNLQNKNTDACKSPPTRDQKSN